MNKQYIYSALVGAASALLVLFIGGLVGNSAGLFGAAGTGYTHYQAENFLQGFYGGTGGQFLVKNTGAVSSSAAFSVTGSSTLGNTTMGNGALSIVLSSSTPSSTLSVGQECGNQVILVTVTASSFTTGTIALAPASTTNANCITNVGGSRYIDIINQAAATSTLTISTSSGMTAFSSYLATSSGLTAYQILGGNAARLMIVSDTSSTQQLLWNIVTGGF